TIDLGKYGRPQVAGGTVADIEKIVNASVAEKNKEASFINVRLVNRVSKRYYVLGEVHTPGAFTLQGSETVLDGLMAAGGLNTQASLKNIILVRPSHPDGCRTVLAICYPEIVQLGDTSTNYQLRPGDRIYVSTKGAFEGLHHKLPCVTCTGPHRGCEFPGKQISQNGSEVVQPGR
ncbi:MAG: SLBB domain-containing protein, partial [Planctomycetes bacterium]|nr:SLBB domain-containing protein [Planctomycetota bacterium]